MRYLSVETLKNLNSQKQNISTGYVFAKDKDFFVYPNNYHKFVKYFKDTFQHGGISLEEMVVPLSILDAK